MNKFYLILVTVCSILANPANLCAQTVTIPASNTNNASVNDPLGTYFGYERTALIYGPAEIGTAGNISAIGFYLNSNTSAASATDVRIYMKQRTTLFTAAGAYANETTGATLVYGPTTIPAASFVADQWVNITLATSFVYNGTSNLEIIVETNFGGAGGEGETSKQFRATNLSTTGYYQRWNQDNTAPAGNGFLNASRPNVQLTFSNPPCVPGSLAGGTVNSTVTTACAGVPFDLYISPGTASFGSSIVYQWESSPDNITWSAIGGASSVGATLTQTTPAWYRRKMTCSGTDAFSTSIQVNQNSFIDCYCNTGLTITGSSNDIITEVSLTSETADNYTNPSGSSGPGYYIAYDNTPLDLGQQTSASLSITFGSDPNQYHAAWIDFNQNGVFESSENIVLAADAAQGGSTVTYEFYIPATATPGITRMRVRGGSDSPYTIGGACTATAYGETEDYLVNITAPPPCIRPFNIGITALGPTTATIAWSAPAPGPANGYEWQIRTSGAPGSGPTGLAASGTTGAGVTTANVTGLATNTSYSLYVLSVCTTGTSYSLWGKPVIFATLCDLITSYPFIETFETTSASLDCWSNQQVSGSVAWTYEAGTENINSFGGEVTTAHNGTRNAAYYGEGTGSVARLVSPPFDFSGMSPAGAVLRFWYSNQLWDFDQNEMRVYYKTSTFGTWTLIPGAVYDNTKNTGDWTEVELALPGSTTGEYYIAFEGTEMFGYGVTVDDVWVGPVPACNRPSAVMATGVTSSSIEVTFTSPGNNFIVEYGAPGFTPGPGAAAGGGIIVTGTASPVAIPGLAANTEYDVYVREVCTAGADYSDNVLSKTRTQCDAANVPYIQDFTGVTSPSLPTCTSIQDLNAWPRWKIFTPPSNYGFPGNALLYSYVAEKPANDWFYTQGINLTAGTNYELDYKYGTTDVLYPESMEVAYGTMATSTAMTSLLKDYPSIIANSAPPFAKLERISFTPDASGVYYFGFHAYSAADQFRLYLDSIHVKVAPTIDAAITAVTALPNCTANTQLQVTVTNNNLLLLDFTVHPVTVTAAITGTSTGSVNLVLNSGSLAPGATMVVSMPAYNFVPGNYTATVTSGSPDDGITDNNSMVKIFTVNPLPAKPIITPVAPVICAGTIVQLATQFTGTGNPKLTWAPVTGLYVNAAATMAYSTGVDSSRLWAKPAATTTYTVTTTDPVTGCTNTAPVVVTVNNSSPVNIVTVPPANICVTDPGFTLLASPAGGTWTGVGVSGGNSFLPSLTSPGSYTLTYTYNNATSCASSASVVARVQDCPERRRLLRDDAVIIFPNPNDGSFSLRVNSTLYSNLIMKVYTSSGNLVRTQSLRGLVYGQTLTFDFTNLPGGTYMVHMIYDGGVRFSEKIFPVVIGR